MSKFQGLNFGWRAFTPYSKYSKLIGGHSFYPKTSGVTPSLAIFWHLLPSFAIFCPFPNHQEVELNPFAPFSVQLLVLGFAALCPNHQREGFDLWPRVQSLSPTPFRQGQCTEHARRCSSGQSLFLLPPRPRRFCVLVSGQGTRNVDGDAKLGVSIGPTPLQISMEPKKRPPKGDSFLNHGMC